MNQARGGLSDALQEEAGDALQKEAGWCIVRGGRGDASSERWGRGDALREEAQVMHCERMQGSKSLRRQQ
jgi:hypothetical protein